MVTTIGYSQTLLLLGAIMVIVAVLPMWDRTSAEVSSSSDVDQMKEQIQVILARLDRLETNFQSSFWSAFLLREPVRGPKGEQGPMGPAGPQGLGGLRGERGEPGVPGQGGVKGERGEGGEPGRNGEPGQKGVPGQKGEKGSTGAAGPKGETGPSGSKGEIGRPGPKGETGPSGSKGEIGRPGPKGQTGPAGPKGDRGLQGSGANVSRLEAELGEVKRMSQRLAPESCGGRIDLDQNGSRNIEFQVPSLQPVYGCIWVITARTEGPLKLRLVQDGSLRWNSGFTLRAVRELNSNNCAGENMRPTTGELTINSQFVFLMFYGQTDGEGEGFKLNIRDAGSSNSPKSVNFQRKETSFSLRYPLHGSGAYGNHQAFFILGKPSRGMSANVAVSRVQTETCCDHVFLFWINPNGVNTTTCESRSGALPPNMEISLAKNMPFLVFFRSDGTVTAEGFQVDATYY